MRRQGIQARSVARVYDDDTDDYLRHGIGIYVWFLLGETEDEHVARLAEFAGLSPWLTAKRVLDLGCGVGEFLRLLDQMHPGNVLSGVTNSSRQLVEARRRFPAGHFFLADLNRYEGGQIDLLTSIESLGHVHELPSFLRRFRARFSSGGRVLIQDVLSGRGSDYIPSWDYRVRTAAEVCSAAQRNGFRVLAVEQPSASSLRSVAYWRSSRRAQFHQPGVGAAQQCVLYLLEAS